MAPDIFTTIPSQNGVLQLALDWQAAFVENLLQAQRSHYQMLTEWQQSLAAVNQELWDQWVCRFGGGVPLDG